MIPPVAASDRGLAQTVGVFWPLRGCRTAPLYLDCEEKALERAALAGDSPLSEA